MMRKVAAQKMLNEYFDNNNNNNNNNSLFTINHPQRANKN